MDYTLDLGAVTRNMGPLMDGLWVTLQLTLAANAIGVVAGFALALRNSVPVLLTNGIGIFQQSALVAIVGVADLMYQGKTLATATYRPIETFTVVALIYLAISYPVGQFVNWLERRQSYS